MTTSPVWESQDIGHETVVFHRVTGEVHILNLTAAQIWKGLAQGEQTFEEVLENLKRRFPQVPVAHLSHDLETTVRQLKDKGLITSKDPSTETQQDA